MRYMPERRVPGIYRQTPKTAVPAIYPQVKVMLEKLPPVW
jgi:hypothetical protein